MKLQKPLIRFALGILLLCTITTARAQYVALPDSNFGTWLNNNGYSACVSGNNSIGWQLDTTCTRVQTDTSLVCYSSSIYTFAIHDLTGIKYFRHLKYLDCSHNLLTFIPELPSSLLVLQCNSNQITSLSALPSLTSLDCSYNRLTNLSGLPTSLLSLTCSYNTLTTLPVFPSLTGLDCSYNQITTLTAQSASITSLNCEHNQLAGLPALPPALLYFNCDNNLIANMPALPASLLTFSCGNNHLTTLPAFPASLTSLSCSGNQLSTLPSLPALTGLNCSSNHLTTLPTLPTSLYSLACGFNPLDSIPALPATLNYLECRGIGLSSLPALLGTTLGFLICTSNHLTSLPDLPASIVVLYCDSNQLTDLPSLPTTPYLQFKCSYNPNLSCLPRVYSSPLSEFYIKGTRIHCLPNSFTALEYDTRPDSLPLCDITTGCDFYYNIAGNIHQDLSPDCASDSLHPGAMLHNMKVQLSQNGQIQQQFYTFASGGYSFKVDSLSSYQVSIDTTDLPLTVACPTGGVRPVLLTPADSVNIYADFGLSCSSADFGVISIEGGRFRPGFTTGVSVRAGDISRLRYNASCGAGVSGTVRTTLSGALHYAGPAAGALTPVSVAGGALTYAISNLDSLAAGSLDILLSADTNAAIGSQVCVTTVISPAVPDAQPHDDTLMQCFTVRNSFDPNLKEVSPTAQIPANSDWLTYTIHFQNTGTDTAYTVVVRDTLSSFVLPETFSYLASSHKAVVQLMGNALAITFPRINLVDSTTNVAGSQGWIQYKVKSKPNLAIGTQVKNTAYIYFDANAAIATNTAVTSIQLDTTHTHVGIQDAAGTSAIHLYPNPNTGSFTLQTSNAVGGEYLVYDMLGSLMEHHTITADVEAISMSSAATGVYTLLVKNAQQQRAIRFIIGK